MPSRSTTLSLATCLPGHLSIRITTIATQFVLRPSKVIGLSKRAILLRLRKDAAISEEITKQLAVALGKLTGLVTRLASQIELTKEVCFRALKDLSDQGLQIKPGRGCNAPKPRNDNRLP